MLSDKQRQTALKKNSALARNMARRLIADGVEEITLTYYADEGSFHAMRLPEKVPTSSTGSAPTPRLPKSCWRTDLI